jgi:hypothetical protein
MILAHVGGLPVEEALLALAPLGAGGGALALAWLRAAAIRRHADLERLARRH